VISDGAPTGTVTTVLGNIDARSLGRTNYHEHLFQVTPLLPGDELDDEDASRQEAALLRDSGFDAMIDATPTALGRNPTALARISRATGIHVVATTGGHREAHYAPGHWLLELSSGELANRFTNDVQVGMPVRDAAGSAEIVANEAGLPVRAGVLKAGIGYWGLDSVRTAGAGRGRRRARTNGRPSYGAPGARQRRVRTARGAGE
jgi:5-phospho-D-xylono-1,4-lactonase